MSDGLVIKCGPAGGNGKRLVIAELDGQGHRDSFDVDDSFKRSRFRDAVIERFGLPQDAHEWLETQIISAADAEDSRGDNGHVPEIIRFADIQSEQIRWLWPGKFALGKLGLVCGDPGLGKSFFTIDLAARVSLGSKWPDCDDRAPLGSVVLLACEDGLADTVRPRLDAAGADVNKIIALRGVKATDLDGEYSRPVELQRDLDVVRKAVDSLGDCKLLVIDPISAFLGSVDSHSNSEVRSVLQPLGELAEQTGIAVIAVSHLKKGESAAIYRTMGSLGFIAAARTAWAICRDKHDQERRLFLPLKNNVAIDQSGLAFTLSARYGTGLPVVCWEAEPVRQSADEAMAPERRRPGPEPEDKSDAEAFLREALANGPRLVREIEQEARDIHDITKRTLVRARKELGIEAYRNKVPGPWYMRFPTVPTTTPDAPKDGKHGTLGTHAEIQGEREKVAYARATVPRSLCVWGENGGLPDGDDF